MQAVCDIENPVSDLMGPKEEKYDQISTVNVAALDLFGNGMTGLVYGSS